MKQMQDEGDGRKTIDGLDVLEGNIGMDHGFHLKNGKPGKFNKKTGKVDYEDDEADDDAEDKASGGFRSLGKKRETGPGQPVEAKKTTVDYPSLYSLDASTMPGIKKRAVGDEVTLVVKGRIKSASQNEDRHTIDLELREGKLQG